MEQILGHASFQPTCGLKQEGQALAVWEGLPDDPGKSQPSFAPVIKADAYVGQVIPKATQLLVPIGAVLVGAFVLLLRLVLPLARRGCFHGCRDCKTVYIRGNKARADSMLKVGLGARQTAV